MMAVSANYVTKSNRLVCETGGYFFFISWLTFIAVTIKPAMAIMTPIV